MELPGWLKRRGSRVVAAAAPSESGTEAVDLTPAQPGRARDDPALVGHEAPIAARRDDLLDRYAVARALHRSIATAPAGWSTRIGLYGRWGSGKTSVLNLLADLERSRGNVVVRFSAWSAAGEAGILNLFYYELAAQLEADDIDVEPVANWGKRITARLAGRLGGLGNATTQAAGSAGNEVGALVSAAGIATSFGASMVSDWVQMGADDLHRLQVALGASRVVVLIDDIDRADPRAVPKTLLALRELLNWPGFAFVLAFDKEVVARSLAEYSKAYGEAAERFLEKVVDVPFDLPDPSPAQAARLARQVLDECCPFMSEDQRAELARWLPANPRQAKLTARKLGVLRDVAARHDAGELDWLALGLQQVLRDVHPGLATAIERGHLFKEGEDWEAHFGVETTPHVADTVIRETATGVPLAQRAWLDKLARRLVEVRRLNRNADIAYEMRLLFQEPAVTAREFATLQRRWHECPEGALAAELDAAAERGCCTRATAAEEILQSALRAYDLRLYLAEQTHGKDDHIRAITLAREDYVFVEHLFGPDVPQEIASLATAADTVIALRNMLRWHAASPANEEELQLRERELALMRRAAAACDDKVRLFVATRPFEQPHGHPQFAAAEAFDRALRAAIADDVVDEVLGWFQACRVGAALRGDAGEFHDWLLGAPASPLYRDGTTVNRLAAAIDAISKISKLGPKSLAIDGVWQYTRMLLDRGDRGVQLIGDEQARRDFFAAHPEIGASIWRLLTAEETQRRVLPHLRALHRELIAVGMRAADLPVPDWLAHDGNPGSGPAGSDAPAQ